MQAEKGIRYFPIALFASVMGLSGFTMSLKMIEDSYQLPRIASKIMLAITSLLFIINIAVFIYRFIAFRADLKQDFNHPVKMNFFGAISISLLLLGALYQDIHTGLSYYIWLAGASSQLILTLLILSKLIWTKQFQLAQFNPVWFLPIVGNIVVPIAGASHTTETINWIFFSIGLVFSIIYFTIAIIRFFFEAALPAPLRPTMFILLAPPGIGFVSYVSLTGQVDRFALILFGLAFYLGLLFTVQIRRFIEAPFSLSWWAYLFPTAAVTNATIILYEQVGEVLFRWIYHLQFAGLIVLTGYLLYRTIQLTISGRLWMKEG